jgi:hypothetical protein
MSRRSPATALIVAALAVVPLLASCYTHVPVALDGVAPPAPVRAHLSSEGAGAVAAVLGTPRSTLDGELVEVAPGAIFLMVPTTAARPDQGIGPLHQKLRIENAHVVGLQSRRLDRTRTAAVVGAGAAAAGIIFFKTLVEGTRKGTTRPGGDGATEIRIPLLGTPFH